MEQSYATHNFQIGIFDGRTGEPCGCAGLRMSRDDAPVLGVELAPAKWDHFALALDVAAALVGYGLSRLRLSTIVGNTSSGNKRGEKLARWFDAKIIAERDGPEGCAPAAFEK
jgi:RimJ/RimL family protein N-acetyltransferase